MAKYNIGDKVGRLTIIDNIYRPELKYKKYYLCKCECGKMKEIRRDSIGRSTFSCGCLNIEKSTKRLVNATKTHGMSDTKLFAMWRDMRNRCYNEKVDRYENYGGRGIKVCDEWNEDFEPFMEWAISNRYKEDLSIDRINVNGNYEPLNCRFIPIEKQSRNRTTNVMVDYYGKTICIKELSEITGLNDKMLYARYSRGDRGERLWRKPRQTKSTPR